MAGDDHACVAKGAAVALRGISFDQSDLHAASGAIEGCAESDDTSADDGDLLHGVRKRVFWEAGGGLDDSLGWFLGVLP